MAHFVWQLAVDRAVCGSSGTHERSGEHRSVLSKLCSETTPDFFDCIRGSCLATCCGRGAERLRSYIVNARQAELCHTAKRGLAGNRSGFSQSFSSGKHTTSTDGKADVGCNLRDSVEELESNAVLVSKHSGELLSAGLVLVHLDHFLRGPLITTKRSKTQWDFRYCLPCALTELLKSCLKAAVVFRIANVSLYKLSIAKSVGLRFGKHTDSIRFLFKNHFKEFRCCGVEQLIAAYASHLLLVFVERSGSECLLKQIVPRKQRSGNNRVAHAVRRDTGFRLVCTEHGSGSVSYHSVTELLNLFGGKLLAKVFVTA